MKAITLPAGVEHGTLTGYYNHGCRCCRCGFAASSYQDARRERVRAGIATYIETERVAAHLEELTTAGVRLRWIERETGVSMLTLRNIQRRVYPRTRRHIAEAVMALGPFSPVEDWAYVDARLARAEVLKLYQRGFQLKWMAEQLEMQATDSPLSELVRGNNRYCRVYVARGIFRLSAFVGDSKPFGRDLSGPLVQVDMAALDRVTARFESITAVLPKTGSVARAYWRLREGRRVTLANAEQVANALGVDVRELVPA